MQLGQLHHCVDQSRQTGRHLQFTQMEAELFSSEFRPAFQDMITVETLEQDDSVHTA